MKNTHWIDFTYQLLIEAGLPMPEFKFQNTDAWLKPAPLEQALFDSVPLACKNDFLGREIRHEDEIITDNKLDKFRERFDSNGICTAQIYGARFNKDKNWLGFGLVRQIIPLTENSEQDPSTYRVLNSLEIYSEDRDEVTEFYGILGRDFISAKIEFSCERDQATIGSTVIAELKKDWSKQRGSLTKEGIDPDEVERQQSLMSPEQYIREFTVPYALEVYNTLIK